MEKRYLWSFLGMVLMGSMLTGPSSDILATKTVAPEGTFQVGVRVINIEHADKPMPALVWYPARHSSSDDPYVYNTGIQGMARENASPHGSAAPYPLVVFSHGMGGCAPQHVFVNENLASHGYVVYAPDHDESAMCHIRGEPDISSARLTWSVLKNNFNLSGVVMDLFGEMMAKRNYDFSYRPAEVNAVIDRALKDNASSASFMYRMIDSQRIGMCGHSLGGYTGLMIAGMPYYCDSDPSKQECDFNHITLDNTPNPCCLEYIREMEPRAFKDSRVKATLAMSPAIMFPELDRAAAALDQPVMLINGDDENFEVPWSPLQVIYDNAPPPKYLVRLKNTDHMTAVDSTLAIPLAKIALPGFRFRFKEKANAYKRLSVFFFDRHLKGMEGKRLPESDFATVWKDES